MELAIRKALPEEAAAFSNMAVRSKAHWGYSLDQLESWGKEFLKVSSEYIREHQVWVGCIHSVLAGFSGVRIHDWEAELDHLWIMPEYIGSGIGKQLFLHTARRLNEMGYSEIVFTSDPHSDGFYLKLGACKTEDFYSTLQKTTLSRFKFVFSSRAVDIS